MNALCNNMLLSSQIEAGGYRMTNEEVNMGTIVQGCINDFKTRFPNRDISDSVIEDAYIVADTLLIQMAVNNLLDNALKYSSKENRVFVKLIKNNSDIELLVIDEGPGIKESERKKVFEKFYRLGNEATRRAKGTGLGLYLTQKIVAAHQGKIFIADNNPLGAVFIIRLKQAV